MLIGLRCPHCGYRIDTHWRQLECRNCRTPMVIEYDRTASESFREALSILSAACTSFLRSWGILTRKTANETPRQGRENL